MSAIPISFKTQPHNLPPQPTSFIGRAAEVREVIDLLADPTCRLLTIIGAGGVGKTRLAIEAARRLLDDFSHGVHFVPLQPVQSIDFLVPAIAGAVDFSLSGQEDPETQLLNYLGNKDMLLLLDNFEQLLSATPSDRQVEGALLLTTILESVSGVKLLVTSREVLNLQEEWLYPLQGLSVPGQTDNDLDTFDAIQLFEERACRIRRNFSLADERQHVVRICRLVEGMPLAIELAASWLKSLNCAAIAGEIQDNLDFLSTTMRNVPDRHRNMQAVFDQSWQLLTGKERSAFKRLSVFRDGFQREAAETIAGATLPILSTLVDKCMLQREDRYYIHELLRQYGEEKMQESTDEADRIHQAHCKYYADFLHSRLEAVNGPEQRQAAAEIAAELENIRAAWQWAVSRTDVESIHKAATTYYLFCQFQSYFLEGANALQVAADRLEQQPASNLRDLTLAELYSNEGWLRIRVGEFDRAQIVLERSQTLYSQLGIPPSSYMGADPATPLAILSIIQGDYDWAVALCESSRQANEARDDIHNLYFAHYGLTAARLAQGNYKAAYRHAEQSCTLARAAGNHWFLANPLNEWGNVARAMGDHAEARQHYQASYAIKEEFNDPQGMAVALSHLGEIAVLQAEFEKAGELFQRSLEIYRDLNDRGGLATSLKGLGQVACARQDRSAAREQFRQALQIAMDIRFLPLVCSTIIEAERLLRQQGVLALSAALLTMVQEHPASDHETKTRAGEGLNQLAAEMAADDFSEAVERGQRWDLATGAATLQAQLEAQAKKDGGQSTPKQPLIDPLTDRELEVLHLMAGGYTNPEIAEALVIALGTAKWYASQIYHKLRVANRTEATVRAHELGLLE